MRDEIKNMIKTEMEAKDEKSVAFYSKNEQKRMSKTTDLFLKAENSVTVHQLQNIHNVAKCLLSVKRLVSKVKKGELTGVLILVIKFLRMILTDLSVPSILGITTTPFSLDLQKKIDVIMVTVASFRFIVLLGWVVHNYVKSPKCYFSEKNYHLLAMVFFGFWFNLWWRWWVVLVLDLEVWYTQTWVCFGLAVHHSLIFVGFLRGAPVGRLCVD